MRNKEVRKKWDNSVSYVKRLEEPDQGGPKKLVPVSTNRKKWEKMGDGKTFEEEIETKRRVLGGNLDIGKGFGVKNGAQTKFCILGKKMGSREENGVHSGIFGQKWGQDTASQTPAPSTRRRGQEKDNREV